jgi:glycosyltransferase involved in cell wall biosynthesis
VSLLLAPFIIYLRNHHTMVRNITISIVTATWNCANTLPDCLASVARQSYANREHVIVDGASTDETFNVINQHIGQIATFKCEPDKGIYDALNKGIHLATGDVVGFLHADDLYASDEVLVKIAKAFEDPEVCAVYGDLEYVSRQDTSKVIRRWQSKPFNQKDLGWGWMPAHPTLYVRRDWYAKIGGFDISYRIAADYLSILQLFTHPDFKAVYIPGVLVTMRLGGASNKSVKAIVKKSKEDWRALRSCDFSMPGALRAIAWKNLSKLRQFRF